MAPSSPPHQPTFCCSSHSPDTCPHPLLYISRSSTLRPTLQTLALIQSSTSADLLLFAHSPDTCPHPVLHISRSSAVRPTLHTLAPIQSSTSADLLLFAHSPDTCPHPVLYISRSSTVRPTLQTLALIQSSTSADLLLFVPLSRHLPPSSPPHQPIFCCSSHSPHTCPHPVLHISRSSAVRPISRHLPSSSPLHQPIFYCSSHSPDTCPHPVLYISRPSTVRPTLQTLIQSSTSADLLLFVPLSRHLPSSSPLHQPTFYCSSHSPDTHPVLYISRSSTVRPTLQTLSPIQSSTSADLLLFVPLSRHSSSPLHQPIFYCSSHSPDTCPHPVLYISRSSAVRPTLQTLIQSSTSADLLLFVPLSRHLTPSSPLHQLIFYCSSHSPDTCPHPVLYISRSSTVRPTLQTLALIQSSTSADLLLFVPLSRHLPSSSPLHQPIFCCSSQSPDTCPHPVLYISRSSAVRPTLQTLGPIQSSTSADLLLFVRLSRHLTPSSPLHQPIFYCSSHSPDTCSHPVLYISRSSTVRPTLQTLAPIQSSTSADLLLFVPLSRHSSSPLHQPIFCCSSHSPDTCPHPVLYISRSSAVRPTLQTLAPIQSSTSADLLLFVPLSRHLPPSSPLHQPIFYCSSHSPDTCPHPVLYISRSSTVRPTLQTLIQSSTSADLLLFVPLSRHLLPSSPLHQPIFYCSSHSPDTCPHPVLYISRSSTVRPTLQTLIQSSTSADLLLFVPLSRHLPPSSPLHQPIFCCSSHSPDTCPHPVLYISRSSTVRPTLQTLALIQSSTSADLLLFVPLSRHSSSPLHQPIFCCSSHSPDTCPHPVLYISRSSTVRLTLQTLIQSSTSADLLLFVPLSRHLPPSSPLHQLIFYCSSHSPDTHPVLYIS